MQGFEIAIAGCGPAGLAAALLLARAGHHVTLFDRFPEPRPLGSGLMLQPSGMAVLAQLGLARAVLARGAPIERLLGRSATGRTVLDARYADLSGPTSLGLGIHRASLFDVLYDAVRATGVTVHPDHAVAGSHTTAGGRMLQFERQGDLGPFDLVIDALGLHTTLAPECGRMLPYGALWASLPWPEGGPFDRRRLEQRYRAAREMVGVLPTGQRTGRGEELSLFWSLRGDAHARWLDRGLEAWREEVVALWPDCAELVAQITDPGQLTMARYAHRALPAPAQDRLVHIGDAWHTASPQLGQGANMALLDAMAAARAVELTRDPRAVPDMAIHLRRWHVELYQAATAFFTPLYQSDAEGPAALRDLVFAPASQFWPGKQVQAQIMSGLLGNPLGMLGLDRVDYAELMATA